LTLTEDSQMSMIEKLAERNAVRGPVLVGVIGAGQMGTGLVVQLERLPWARVTAVADVDLQRAQSALEMAGVRPEEIVVTEDPAAAQRASEAGRRVITRAATMLAAIPIQEVVVDATGVPEVGARAAHAAIGAGKHIVMLNVEADITVGRMLRRLADKAGVVYTCSAGDEYAAAMELVEFATVLGFDIVAAGKGKNNPLDYSATPDDMRQRAAEVGANPWMLASFVDGTKTAVEMTCLANATGFAPDVRGMHGPHANLADLPKLFRLQKDGGILNGQGVVDYAIGVAPGVFVVIETDEPVIAKDLKYLKLGDGPQWVLFRPYHLANLETPLSIARAVVYGEPTIAPRLQATAETVAVAKRDLMTGDILDAIGGHTSYGLIERADIVSREGLLPLGIAEGARVVVPVRRGEPIPRSAVEFDESGFLHRMRLEQEELESSTPATVEAGADLAD
jgi:predicted homoserine dehydrogenase-like protein